MQICVFPSVSFSNWNLFVWVFQIRLCVFPCFSISIRLRRWLGPSWMMIYWEWLYVWTHTCTCLFVLHICICIYFCFCICICICICICFTHCASTVFVFLLVWGDGWVHPECWFTDIYVEIHVLVCFSIVFVLVFVLVFVFVFVLHILFPEYFYRTQVTWSDLCVRMSLRHKQTDVCKT